MGRSHPSQRAEIVRVKIDLLKDFTPDTIAERSGDAKLLNGPKFDNDAGHASQDDIDALLN